ncbi:MAG: hypothetical protein QOI34_260 [Verrucomicrobiota bacterium]|jgi:hypothetical protein
MPFVLRTLFLFTALTFAAENVRALTLDWDATAWTPGTLTNSYDIDPNSPGNDVTVTISGNTNRLTTDPTTGAQTPAITNSLEGGTSPVQSSLHLAADLHTNDTITVTVTFSAQYLLGVEGVSFKIFDIDTETNADEIHNISATTFGTGVPVAGNVTNAGSAVNVTGLGLTQVLIGNADSPNTGVNSSNGNVTIDFGSAVISSFTFTFQNTPGAPRIQQIGLFDINFSPVPEMNPALMTICSCAGAAGFILFQRARIRRSKR